MVRFESEKGPENKTPIPGALDVVKLDGRWAQVAASGESSVVIFLDNGENRSIVWDRYRLVRSFDSPIEIVRESGENISDEELKRVRWGPEEEQDQELKRLVTVFGEYVSKQ